MASIKSMAEDAAKIAEDARLWEDNVDWGRWFIHNDLKDPQNVVDVLEHEDKGWTAFERFDTREAMVIGMAILELWSISAGSEQRRSNDKGIAVTITLFNGVILFASGVGDHVSADNFEWARRKTNTVKRFGTSSWLHGQRRLVKGKPADDPLLGPDYAAHGGAYPIRVKGSKYPIGAIAVSGLTQAEDHGFITAVLSRYLLFHQRDSYLRDTPVPGSPMS